MRKSPLYEVVGQLGMWGTLINGIQAAGLEHKAMTLASWNGATSEQPKHHYHSDFFLTGIHFFAVGLLIAYTAGTSLLSTHPEIQF